MSFGSPLGKSKLKQDNRPLEIVNISNPWEKKMESLRPFKLGQKVKCRITGFTGIVTAKIEYINGCIQYCVKPPCVDNKRLQEGEYIDWQHLEFVDEGVSIPKETKGCENDTPPSNYIG
jgi:hypothetical protein